MRIQHNIMAMSAYRNYTNNVSAMKKNLEKLSSGYKINRAGDDAAGLAISEKMRAQITGLETAQKNAKDGISLVQTAEGALTEVHDMLNRMVELATMSANGTYDDTTDRAQLQKEVDQLRSEIDRIADSANFNGIKLLNGDLAETPGSSASVDVASWTNVAVTVAADGNLTDKQTTKGVYSIDLSSFKGNAVSTGTTVTLTVGGVAVATATATTTGGAVSAGDFSLGGTTSVSINGVTFNLTLDGEKLTLTMANDPASAGDTAVTMTASITGAATNAPGGGAGNQGHPLSVKIETPAVYAEPRVYAQANFDLASVFADGIKDGSSLKIGDSTYVFAVGADSKFKGGAGVIDLTDMTEGSVDNAEAARRLTVTAADNKQFKVTNNNNGTQIDLTEKEGGFKDYSVFNLAGGTGTTDGVWNGLVDGVTVSLVQTGQATATEATQATGGLTLQIGDTAERFNQLRVSIGDTHCTSLGIDDANLSIANQTDAAQAIDKIKAAINKVSDIRGTLGATQNRLDHTINNLSVMTENIQDAESTIRDVDVAEEMMAYTKNNILIQSAQAMLAQANQVPQGVLQLLQ